MGLGKNHTAHNPSAWDLELKAQAGISSGDTFEIMVLGARRILRIDKGERSSQLSTTLILFHTGQLSQQSPTDRLSLQPFVFVSPKRSIFVFPPEKPA